MSRVLVALLLLALGGAAGLLLSTKFQLGAEGLQYRPVQRFADGGIYAGPLDADGLATGSGSMVWPNGDRYEGEFHRGMMQGNGRLTTPYGFRYQGEFAQGQPHGRGTMEFTDGAIYIGAVEQGNMQGQGTLTYANGNLYEGEFKLNVQDGSGTWIVQNNHTYRGQLKNALYHGRGDITYTTGDRYTGQFHEGSYHGAGRFVTALGDAYDGEFSNNVFSGKGVITSADGSTYVGEVKDWMAHGNGIKTDPEGNQYIGQFANGMLQGEGEYVGADGERYQGHFEYGQYSGAGELWTAAGDHYRGEFAYGTQHGTGEWVSAQGERYQGQWRRGQLISAQGDITIHKPESIVEHALYQQVPMLEAALAKVTAGRDDRIELFTLAIAPYGSEEVFNREINYIEQDFHARFGNGEHSIFLSNSRRTLDQHPLATLTSVEKSLSTLAGHMNPGEDILFLYISSHGSPDKTIAFEQPGLAMEDLSAQALSTMLEQSGIKWRVIVLSACYSGGFIDALQNDHTLVITAAAADKPSFGCADNNDFTYFGEAYFKEALPRSTGFVEAFSVAESIIKDWEAREQKDHSHPQIAHGNAILEQLEQWRAQPAASGQSLSALPAITDR